ncbi:hypothetical protein EGI26_21025 [Lacihabitans sp. CCS-44]|uniref:hypothetical protein n=1 Tax=Lacihabitans sp. CCS-44 TaxID=2487331 RepID=UPI0020CEF992|nr:hypothetical protein [Lacihabitans sp. CCS-44]MCP9757654.1 hypothetical protein [Lacihabitans sp. CCS-44]
MKNIKIVFNLILILLAFQQSIFGQNGQKAECNLGSSKAYAALSELSVKSGKGFTLALSVPAGGCSYDITIETGQNLEHIPTTSYPHPLTQTSTSPPKYTVHLGAASMQNIDQTFRFKPGETCNGEKGTFKVKYKRTCGTVIDSCETTLSIVAVAQNYWTVSKTHVWGDLRGGTQIWKVTLAQAAHPFGEGDLNIYSGTIKDMITPGPTTIITGVSTTASGIGTNTATWNTGTISSYTSQVNYYVHTTSCEPLNSTITNCLDYNFCLGKPVSLITDTELTELSPNKVSEKNAKKVPGIGTPIDPLPKTCCDRISGKECASVVLKGQNMVTAPLAKSHLFSSTTNYTTGCGGIYRITISNNGNVPIGNLNLTDLMPAGINPTKITISGTAGLNYNLSLTGGGGPFIGNTGSSTQYLGSFSGLNFQTTSGSLTNDYIYLDIEFTITGAPGTTVKNCAKLTFDGIFNGSATICGLPIPPITGNNVTACDEFVIEQPRAIPLLRKCVIGTGSHIIGDNIKFRILVANHGSANFSGNLNDLLSSPQSLELVGSPTYQWGIGNYNPYSNGYLDCNASVPNTGMPTWVTPNLADLSNPKWAINNMPGDCNLYSANYLIIEFEAKVKPQTYGPYYNEAKLVSSTGTLNAQAGYNIIALGNITPTKLVNSAPGNAFASSSAFVDPGNPFQFSLRFMNTGSVNLKNLKITDMMPTCVTVGTIFSIKKYLSGSVTGTSVTGTTPSIGTSFGTAIAFSSSFVLSPGDFVEVIVNVTAKPNYVGECCNPGFKIDADNTLSGIHLENYSGPACIKPLNCCSIPQSSFSISPKPSNSNDWLNLNVNITAGPIPIQEVTIALVDYHVIYNFEECKPLKIGNGVSNIQSISGGLPFNIGGSTGLLQAMALQNPNNIRNQISWNLGQPTSFNLTKSIPLSIMRPDLLNIPCCNGEFYYCLKITIKDANCNVCEKLICSKAPLYKPISLPDNIGIQNRLMMPTQKSVNEKSEICENCIEKESFQDKN